jgi:hypothetical protein
MGGGFIQAGNICKFVSEFAPRISCEITSETDRYRITMMSDEMKGKKRRERKNKE